MSLHCKGKCSGCSSCCTRRTLLLDPRQEPWGSPALTQPWEFTPPDSRFDDRDPEPTKHSALVRSTALAEESLFPSSIGQWWRGDLGSRIRGVSDRQVSLGARICRSAVWAWSCYTSLPHKTCLVQLFPLSRFYIINNTFCLVKAD